MRTHLLCAILSVLFAGVVLQSCGGGNDNPARRTALRIGTDATYPPFETVDVATGKPSGFDIDLITLVCEINGWTPEFIVTPFDGMIPGLQAKKYDVAISAMTITPERAAAVDFSEPYYLAGQTIAVPLAENNISKPEDLKGKKVGVQLGTTGEMMAKRIEGADVYSFENIGAAFIDMANGNLDAVLNDFPTTQAYIRSHGTAKTVGEILSKEQYGIAIRKGEAELRDSVNAALVKLKSDGRYRQLHLTWFGTEPAGE